MEFTPRQQYIHTILKTQHTSVAVNDLSNTLKVSEASIRTDLRILETNGLIIRTPGGAILKENGIINNIKETIDTQQYQDMIKLLLSHIPNDSTIIIDFSPMAISLCKVMVRTIKPCTVITHSFDIAIILQNSPYIKLYFCGGMVNRENFYCVGDIVVQNYSYYHASIALLGIEYLHLKKGLMEQEEHRKKIKLKIMEQAQQVWLLAESTSFNQSAMIRVAEYSEIDAIYTDQKLPEEWYKFADVQRFNIYNPE